jgi:predicted NAD/FAD-dependent oxidoreductase
MGGGQWTRRATLAVPLAALPSWTACTRHPETGFAGGWVGASRERGHLLVDAAAPGQVPDAQGRCAVAIVGGGVAGLAAARALMRSGIDDIRLFELEDGSGGNARGHTMAGMACPLGAHYLPQPGPQAHEVRELLHDLGLLKMVAGREVPDERHLCHSPQERLWIDGQWTEGLLPPADPGSERERQYRHFARLVAHATRTLGFAIPSVRAPWKPGHAELDAMTFARWLQMNGLDDPALRWYLDYTCRDDYGADAAAVSAWAGLHYFGSRHGFQAPGDDVPGRDGVFTWPEGNAWLTRRLAEALGERAIHGAVVRRVEVTKHAVDVDVTLAATGRTMRWTAEQAILALPLHAAVRVVAEPPAALRQAAAVVPHAPWLVTNLQLKAALTDKPGAPPSWDNVLYEPDATTRSGALGYVDAMHQTLRPVHGATVLTAYWALGRADAVQTGRQRRALADDASATWSGRIVADLARAHPDLPDKIARVDLMRYGHAMALPVPGVRDLAALRALAPGRAASRLHFAHGDLAGYSIFEEAYTLGVTAARAAAGHLRS